MKKTRRKHSGEFKTKVVLEMLKEVETLSEISSKYGVQPTQVTKWKRSFLERAPELFSENGRRSEKEQEEVQAELYKKIGQLQVEIDFLKKKSGISL
jgi:transposase